jgi:hypothetical protein
MMFNYCFTELSRPDKNSAITDLIFSWVQPLLLPKYSNDGSRHQELTFDLLPAELKEVLSLYSSIRDRLSDANSL